MFEHIRLTKWLFKGLLCSSDRKATSEPEAVKPGLLKILKNIKLDVMYAVFSKLINI